MSLTEKLLNALFVFSIITLLVRRWHAKNWMMISNHLLLLGLDFLITFTRRDTGTLPILGSPAITNSHARSADSSKSGASAGKTCQPVTFFPNTRIDLMLGKSRPKLG